MPKRSIAPLVNGRVRLRLIEEADLPMTLAWGTGACINAITFGQWPAWNGAQPELAPDEG